jgi:hypothetical protein
MKFLLVVYLLSSGYYQEPHISAEDCEDTLKLTEVLYGTDLWSGVCIGPDDEVTMKIMTDIGP